MIEIETLPKGRYLLGFSGGVDSSALFFLLLDLGVEFDIAIVDYGLREQSKEEVVYAKKLARLHQKLCFCTQAPQFMNNFESQAREFRYEFFSQIIKRGYDGLILAHQLDDRFEWTMMQMCKGAGLNTLLGFDFVQSYREYLIYRPLWKVPKASLYQYCKQKGIAYFEDLSNQEEKYTRNIFRQYLQPLILKYSRGIEKSLEYLNQEKKRLYKKKEITEFGDIASFQRGDQEDDLHQIDLLLKKRGYLLSALQKKEIIKENFVCEIGGKWIIESDEGRIYLCSKVKIIMDKDFRDLCRKLRIPRNIRANVFALGKKHQEIKEFFLKN
ncbi:tRNA lysidine(34) synthetase TilS [Helicobacter cholecystus]|uniref:tRNA(Ile)-lysidine synthase n=1 Tax=Helicobacter cholecystus TaxID=45498 RepID=A0A3D8IZD5_9HELI|nr:tRNA lysidine(34) synthetase TilS [Helicobacter cholecystus]RDU69984.1 tRNA lysidine(34) synthetase TilS [Helicobacter cholecystus]VEJ24847.1 tRNA(Ile)-lysidine synthase TilS [Helicobacter cholecystus]